MFGKRAGFISLVLTAMLMLLLPSVIVAQSEYAHAGQPPIGQPLIREGDFAVKLAGALSLGTSRDEVEAENQLSAAGITPKNGWIADYPVTPDIIDELYKAVHETASSGKIQLSVDLALQRFNDVVSQAGLPVDTQPGAKTESPELPAPPSYPNPAVINNYYQTEGPPAVTYYAPPPDYAYLYGWVPAPFWSFGFWFPGFFILHDFHRPLFFADRTVFVSNHFRDFRHQRTIRLDPIARIRGNNIADTRVFHTRGGIPSGTSIRGGATIREPRQQTVGGNAGRQAVTGGAGGSTVRNSISAAPRAGGSASIGISSRDMRTTGISTRGAGGSGIPGSGTRFSPPPSRSAGHFSAPRSVSSSGISGMPTRGGRMISMPSMGGGSGRMSFGGGSGRMSIGGSNAMGGRGRR